MKDVVEQALQSCEWIGSLEPAQVTQSRAKIMHYIDILVSAGQKDPDRLTEYACAYLREMYEGHDPRFTGC